MVLSSKYEYVKVLHNIVLTDSSAVHQFLNMRLQLAAD